MLSGSARVLKVALTLLVVFLLFPTAGFADEVAIQPGAIDVSDLPPVEGVPESSIGYPDVSLSGPVIDGKYPGEAIEEPEIVWSKNSETVDIELSIERAALDEGTLYKEGEVLVIYDSILSLEEQAQTGGWECVQSISTLFASEAMGITVQTAILQEGVGVFEAIEQILMHGQGLP